MSGRAGEVGVVVPIEPGAPGDGGDPAADGLSAGADRAGEVGQRPTFWPWLIPDTTRSGSRPSSSRATVTVSAGKPSTAVPSCPLAVAPSA